MSANSIRELLEIANQQSPDKIALIENGKRYSYRELFTKVNQLANYFRQLELGQGSRVGIYSNKSSEQVIAILALLSTEYIIVPITRFLKPEQVKYIVKDASIETIITDRTKIKNIEKMGFEGRVITFEPLQDELVSFREIYKCFNSKQQNSIENNSSAVITYSFGSDGSQKGIVMSHQNLVDGARVVSKYLELQGSDVISGMLSFNLDYGLNQIFCSLYNQATLALHKFILPSDFFAHLLRDRVTVLALMPVHISKMFDEDPHRLPTSSQLDHIRVITSSGGNITPEMVKKVDNYYKPAKFYSMHGLTEALRSTYLEPSQIHIRPTSIGKAIPEVEIYIINEDGEECKTNEVGELIHRGCCIYKGYWNSEKETKKRFKNISILAKLIEINNPNEIVIATGDFVYRDEDGYIYLVDRKDDMIKTNGYRVSPKEIEGVVYQNFKTIKECAVFGIPNRDIEEEIVLVYSAKTKMPKNEILFELKKHLATYMMPTIIEYRASLPLNASHHETVDKSLLKNNFK
ncbi:AMP-binding protein [Sulfurovum sp. bin170]|uniref:AMP-binding protein n=1 Tax=Sulfurovum sp. bin170 TaxID=2695268 RepID=UPI0013E0BECD|nr:AMP-binding protein [Sulfurovum sp. bin170]NEW59790.1 AMP-binding protein [Sulfurovum sp. bin170]